MGWGGVGLGRMEWGEVGWGGASWAGPGWAGPGWRGAGTRDCFWDCRVLGAGGWAGTAHLRTTSPSDPRPLARAISPKLAPDKNVTDIILSSSFLVSLSSYSI